jgi:hypothetical protein
VAKRYSTEKAKCASCHLSSAFYRTGLAFTHAGRNWHRRFPGQPFARNAIARRPFVASSPGWGRHYHDGRFATQDEVVNHYKTVKKLNLADPNTQIYLKVVMRFHAQKDPGCCAVRCPSTLNTNPGW